ncbi:glycosyltransferase family 2 protein [Clostridium perfringens]|uniref:glycosyltransferase family 2 protein n=1 Tax=Clostridium perfringens TaxID=1502 RepID=UPI0028E0EB1A|nr:glycosyltransferase family 2 protein [Clostridium perfringens]MDT9331574.1 glycosyltransferase family 2 protein [Clostridium perfringens]
MNKIKVSILIPVYNTEKYLRKCLDSVINQTLKEIEIIITNDGSTDNSEVIVKEFIELDNRIIYSKQENSGLGATRNKGLELASGEYIAFLDSDDWVDNDFYEVLYEEAKKDNYDLVVSTYLNEFKDKTILNENKSHDRISYLRNILSGNEPGFSWNKLYKRELIKNHNLKFPLRGYFENVEDQYFTIRSIYYSKNVGFTNISNIHYRHNEDSIVNKYQNGLINDIEKLYLENLKLFDSQDIYLYMINKNLLNGIIGIIINEMKSDRKANKKDFTCLCNSIMERKTYSTAIKDYKKYKFSLKDKICYELLLKKSYITLFFIAKLRYYIANLRR